MTLTMIRCAALLAALAPLAATARPAPAAAAPHAALDALFADWRRFVVPPVANGITDYSPAAMARMAAGLPMFRARLTAINRNGWPQAAVDDARLVEAEMNGLDFDLRVLRPWARDPTFYATVFADMSDVPAHEGPYPQPNIDLYTFAWPLRPADDKRLAAMLGAIPPSLATAKVNLAASNAKDLFAYGDRAFVEQGATLAALAGGTLVMRTLDGRRIPAPITGASPALRRAIAAARAATDDFAAWIAAEAPKKTGPSGVGKANYDWYVRHVELLPYSWDEQVVLLRRELDRSIASLRLEEVRNRELPPATPLADPAAYARLSAAKSARLSDFLESTGLGPKTPWARAAIAAQTEEFTPADKRNFFSHVTAIDPLPLLSHSTHWIDLARRRSDPHASAVRRATPLYNIYANRSEGFATAFEEIVMHAGLYDDVPRGRELVWIMLANRAARGLASLYVQSNEWDLARAGRFHAEWTPRGWSDPASPLVGFEQLLYLRQPGYGPSYVTGKLELDRLIADASHRADVAGTSFVMADFMARVMAAGIVPNVLIGDELANAPVMSDRSSPSPSSAAH